MAKVDESVHTARTLYELILDWLDSQKIQAQRIENCDGIFILAFDVSRDQICTIAYGKIPGPDKLPTLVGQIQELFTKQGMMERR